MNWPKKTPPPTTAIAKGRLDGGAIAGTRSNRAGMSMPALKPMNGTAAKTAAIPAARLRSAKPPAIRPSAAGTARDPNRRASSPRAAPASAPLSVMTDSAEPASAGRPRRSAWTTRREPSRTTG